MSSRPNIPAGPTRSTVMAAMVAVTIPILVACPIRDMVNVLTLQSEMSCSQDNGQCKLTLVLHFRCGSSSPLLWISLERGW